ncbi:BURP domain-containing protein 3 [Capsicum chinense]|nr:BURP domain-containing protein 3 [Capsicum chinense]
MIRVMVRRSLNDPNINVKGAVALNHPQFVSSFEHRQRQSFVQFVTAVSSHCRVRPLPSRQRRCPSELAFVASHAANLSPEVYWKAKLPNAPMPRPIKDALHYFVAEVELKKLRQPWGVCFWYQPAAEGDLHKLCQPWGVGSWYQPVAEDYLKKLCQLPWGVALWYQPAAEGDLHKLRQPWGVGFWYQPAADGDLHKLRQPWGVGSTRTFMVSMVGDDGTKVNAVSVCHEDTASMNPKALPFQLLNVKPGDKPIHFG